MPPAPAAEERWNVPAEPRLSEPPSFGGPENRTIPMPVRLEEEAGFSLLELLVASLMVVLVVGGMLLILESVRDLHRDQQQLIDAQMTARLALDQMQRDIQQAGIGLLGLLAPLTVIEPRADGGIDIRYNGDNLTARLDADMGGTTGYIPVGDETGFAAGMVVVIYDGAASYDMVALTSVQPGQLHHASTLSKAYRVDDGAAVKRVRTTSYYLQAVNDNFSLQRQEDGEDAQPVAINVRSLAITYFDDSNPPQTFSPVTLADQLRIRAIQLDILVETEDVRLNTNGERTVGLSMRITPRSLLLAS